MRHFIRYAILLAAVGPASLACDQAGHTPADEERPPVHVDSVFPIEEEVRRFRADLTEVPTELDAGAAESRDRLVQRFAAALAAYDTVAFRSLVINRAEFAYLYYPFTRYTRRPYELSPALLWFQIQQGSEKGISRALQTYGGPGWTVTGYNCPDSALVEDANRLWSGCTVQLDGPDGVALEKRLFGSILERAGLFKFLSYGNDL